MLQGTPALPDREGLITEMRDKLRAVGIEARGRGEVLGQTATRPADAGCKAGRTDLAGIGGGATAADLRIFSKCSAECLQFQFRI